MTVATHSTTVVLKTESPTSDTAWPSQSNRQFRLCRSPLGTGSPASVGMAASIAPTGAELGSVEQLLAGVLANGVAQDEEPEEDGDEQGAHDPVRDGSDEARAGE